MTWITGSEGDSTHTGASAGGGPGGCCHAVDADSGGTACGTVTRSLQVWEQVPFIRARMAGGELCPLCVAISESEHAPV
jgi:hypothetical protein